MIVTADSVIHKQNYFCIQNI